MQEEEPTQRQKAERAFFEAQELVLSSGQLGVPEKAVMKASYAAILYNGLIDRDQEEDGKKNLRPEEDILEDALTANLYAARTDLFSPYTNVISVREFSEIAATYSDEGTLEKGKARIMNLLSYKEFDEGLLEDQINSIWSDPDKARGCNFIGRYFLSKGKMKKAKKYFEHAVYFDNNLKSAMKDIGVIDSIRENVFSSTKTKPVYEHKDTYPEDYHHPEVSEDNIDIILYTSEDDVLFFHDYPHKLN